MGSLTAKAPVRAASKRSPGKSLKALPEWNLADLYAGIDAPEVTRDLERADADCRRFRDRPTKASWLNWQAGRGGGRSLAGGGEALRGDRGSRSAGSAPMPGSFMPATPSIRRARNSMATSETASPSASTHLLFFELELNRIDDGVLERAMEDPALGHYRPWLEDIRKDKPYQLEDRVEQLFHEKSVTGRGPGTGCSTRPSPACASR